MFFFNGITLMSMTIRMRFVNVFLQNSSDGSFCQPRVNNDSLKLELMFNVRHRFCRADYIPSRNQSRIEDIWSAYSRHVTKHNEICILDTECHSLRSNSLKLFRQSSAPLDKAIGQSLHTTWSRALYATAILKDVHVYEFIYSWISPQCDT